MAVSCSKSEIASRMSNSPDSAIFERCFDDGRVAKLPHRLQEPAAAFDVGGLLGGGVELLEESAIAVRRGNGEHGVDDFVGRRRRVAAQPSARARFGLGHEGRIFASVGDEGQQERAQETRLGIVVRPGGKSEGAGARVRAPSARSGRTSVPFPAGTTAGVNSSSQASAPRTTEGSASLATGTKRPARPRR